MRMISRPSGHSGVCISNRHTTIAQSLRPSGRSTSSSAVSAALSVSSCACMSSRGRRLPPLHTLRAIPPIQDVADDTIAESVPEDSASTLELAAEASSGAEEEEGVAEMSLLSLSLWRERNVSHSLDSALSKSVRKSYTNVVSLPLDVSRRSSRCSMGGYGVLSSFPSSGPLGFPSVKMLLNRNAVVLLMFGDDATTSRYASVTTLCPEGLEKTTRMRTGFLCGMPVESNDRLESSGIVSASVSYGSITVSGISTSMTPTWRRRPKFFSTVPLRISMASPRER
mmetsp:Transcript_39674/g.81237  ORF Transcript_39674/g.81237 Transcript_39674/m.81237 type:complete len:283 (+) Transcript_39674:1249-2097(+)